MNDYRRTCISIVRKDDEVLMFLKRKGLGEGFYNFPGGKVEPNEDPCQCASRELREETCLEAQSLRRIGEITYNLDNGEISVMSVFQVDSFEGTMCDSPEGKPFWTKEIPLDKMWEDDRIWIPLAMSGKKFQCQFFFSSDWKIYKGGECREVN
jgi:8-oxo-dGTP diphosphatase